MTPQASGEPCPTEGEAREAASKDLSPFVVEIPAEAGGGYAWFPAGATRFGEHAEVPRGSRVVSTWGRVKPVVKNHEGRRVFGEPRKGWENVRFGKSRPGPGLRP